MLTWLRKILAPPVFEGDEDKTRIARMLNVILWAALAIVLTSSLSLLVTPYAGAGLLVIGGVVLLILSSLVLMRRGWVQLASGLFSLSLLVFATALPILSGGVNSSIVTEFLVAVCVAGLLLRGRTPFIFAGLVIAISIGVAFAQMKGLLPPPFLDQTNPFSAIIPLIANTIMVAALLYLATRNLNDALERARQSNRELQASRVSLEERVEERTRDLARRTHYLEATAAVAHDAASVLNLEELLGRVASLVSEQFGFYHTGIFLLDPAREWAVLQAASSEGGKQMLARGHRLPVGGKSIVGYVTSRGESRIALDVGADAVFFQNPDLPDTRSEAALPLRARGRAGQGDIIGALDVQSTLPRAFGQEDIAVLQTLADQVAMAISNAQLFRQAQEGLEAERRATAQLTEQAWKELFHVQRELSVVRSKPGLTTASELQRPEIATARRTGKVIVDENTQSSLAAPVKVRDHVIGVIDAHKTKGAWTPEEIALVETLTEQMGVALESARLYQDTQRRAVQEQLVGEITTRMRESLDMETVLKTAANEMRQALGLEGVIVQLARPDTIGDAE